MTRKRQSQQVRNSIFLAVVLVIVTILTLPFVVRLSGLDTPPQIPHLAPAFTAIPASPKAPDPTPTPGKPAEPGGTGAQTVNVDVTVKTEAATEEPAAKGSPAAPWTVILQDNQAALRVVITNRGETAIRPCFIIPAIYDTSGLPVIFREKIGGQTIGPADFSATVIPVNDLCTTGVAGSVWFIREAGEIQPGTYTTYDLALSFPVSSPGRPYTGQLDVYLVGVPPADKTASKLTPYQSLPFTIRDREAATFSGSWKTLRTWADPFLLSLLELLAVGLVLFVLAYYIYPLLVTTFGTPGLSLDTLAADTPTLGQKLTALLQDELDRFKDPSENQNAVTLVNRAAETSNFAVSSKLKETKIVEIVFEILEYIFKRNVIKVSGQTQQSTVKGVGLTLSLTNNRNGDLIDTQTFWELDYSGIGSLIEVKDGAFDPYLLIIQPAATWITYKVSAYLGLPYSPLGTANWQSHACYLCAMYLFGLIGRVNAPKDAKHRTLDLLHTSLIYDPANPVANINLARFETEKVFTQDGDPAEIKRLRYEMAEGRLVRVSESLSLLALPGKKNAKQFGWVSSARYNQAVIKSLMANADVTEQAGLRNQAREILDGLEKDITLSCVLIAAPMPPVDEDREASLNLRKAKNEDILRELIVPPPLLDYLWARIRFRWARLRYENTIRTLIALAEQKSRIYCKTATENDAFIQAIKCLRGIIGLDEGDRPETDFATIKISKDLAQINYRVHYDLACYYSKSLGFVPVRQEQKPLTDTEKEHLRENGFFHLEMALTLPGDLNNYARKDADLDNLRTYQAGARFNAIVDSHVQAAKAAPTNALLDLSKLLEILSEQADIDNLADLLRHGAKPDRRRKLVWQSDEKLTYAQVTRWVRIADLMRLDGMGLTDAELLYEAGISSPQLLAGYKYADLLHEKLVEVNGDKKLVKTQVPTERMLADWIRKASQLKDVVV